MMKLRSPRRRKIVNGLVLAFSAASAALGILALAWVLFEIIRQGAGAINWTFFTRPTAPPGDAGGMANALLGTLILVGLAVGLGVPVGLMAGVYLAEYAAHSRFGALVRFCTNVMMGIPSILVGLYVYGMLVKPMGGFSGWAGATALALLMLPVVSRTTEDMLALVPNALRESALALGAPRWKATVGIVFRAARAGLITGVLLAVARISGETAPLLFTSMNSPFAPGSLSEPMPSLTVTIFSRAMSPYSDWQQSAWGACLVITVAVLGMNLAARAIARPRRSA